MQKSILSFLRDDGAQDLIEYTLLVAFIMFTSTALVMSTSDSVQGILFLTRTNLNAANTSASS